MASSEADGENLAIIDGGGREMKDSKSLVLLNLVKGSYEQLSSEDQTVMTPSFSSDGSTILYAGSQKASLNEGTEIWMNKGNHNIYSVDIKTKKVTQLTNSNKGFDFAPMYIKNKDFVFLRTDLEENISLWKFENG